MRRVDFMLALVVIFQGLFEIMPDYVANEVTYDLFAFSDQRLTIQTYAWFWFGHVVLLLLSYLCIEFSRGYFLARVMFWLQVLYFGDFILTYNENWWGFIEVHRVSMVIFTIAYGWILIHGRASGTLLADGKEGRAAQEEEQSGRHHRKNSDT